MSTGISVPRSSASPGKVSMTHLDECGNFMYWSTYAVLAMLDAQLKFIGNRILRAWNFKTGSARMLMDCISTRQGFVIQEEVRLLSSEHLFHGHFYTENSNCTGKSLQNKTANKMCGSQFFSSQSPNKVKPTLLNSHFTHIITILISLLLLLLFILS